MHTAINHAKIFDGEKVLCQSGSILFDETGILAVGEGEQRGDVTIDEQGRTVLPGLMDCHVHMGSSGPGGAHATAEQMAATIAADAAKILRYGVTTVRNAAEPFNMDLLVRDYVNSGYLDGCRIIAAGRPFGITGCGCPNPSYAVDTPDEMRKAARQQLGLQADFLKMSATGSMGGKNSVPGAPLLTEEMLRVAVEESARCGKLVMVHATNTCYEAAQRAARAGVRSIEHIQMDEETAQVMKANGTYYCPTIVMRYRIIHSTEPEYEYMRKKASLQDLVNKKRAIGLCLKYGIPVAAGTDANGRGGLVSLGDSLHTELGIYVEYGMTPVQALHTATLSAARMMCIDHEVGSLEAGKCADVILVDGDPTENIADISKVERTFRAGKQVYHR